jgi:hypothetical protein
VFEKWVLRKISGPKRDEVIGGWRKLHSEELHNLYCSPSIIRIVKSRRMRWAGHVAGMGEKRRRWKDDIIMDLREREWGGIDWIDLAQDRDQ